LDILPGIFRRGGYFVASQYFFNADGADTADWHGFFIFREAKKKSAQICEILD